MKQCTHCGLVKPLDEFYPSPRGLGGRESYCKACQRERSRLWREANPLRALEACRRVARRYYQRFPERVKANATAAARRRRARLLGCINTLTEKEWQQILVQHAYSCIYCGNRGRLSQDHLVPLSRGGGHSAENVRPACLQCNQRKGNKTAEEFLAWREALYAA